MSLAPPPPNPKLTLRLITAAWLLALIGAVALIVRYDEMPQHLLAYRSLVGQASRTVPKSPMMVARIALMGVAQLGAITAMAYSARNSGGWLRFWTYAAITAGAKTLFQCFGFAQEPEVDRTFFIATLLVVATFLAVAYALYKRHALKSPPPLGRERIWLGASLATWAFFASVASFV